ncbi:alpha/beta hydrolase [Nocardia colli]|uniref:Alpha/beta hydrolase n=1 Tax=Nocardia colli TaxID=2545717 RepID=A0A5N0DXB2_9NOCA|nr:alpha/beta hydrolase [Nocardia colli]KAA8880594.1 alpha/beta hydrolase [Nocardia colli]
MLDANFSFGTMAETAAVQALMGEAQPVIIVGVGTAADPATHWLRRLRDYTPGAPRLDSASPTAAMIQRKLSAVGHDPHEWMGHAPEFLRFLQDEPLPRLMTDYPVDSADIGACGHSAGGAFLSYVLLRKAPPFTKLIIGSFGVNWYTPETLARLERTFAGCPAGREVQVYSAFGGAELADHSINALLRDSFALLDRLAEADPGYTFTRQVFDRQGHGSMIACLAASGIRHLWPGKPYTEAAETR